jgi:hypothetical protein
MTAGTTKPIAGCQAALVAITFTLSLIVTARAQTGSAPGNARPVPKPMFGCEKGFLEMDANPPASRIPGCIRGADQSAGPIGVRISSVHLNKILNEKVNSSGEFSFKNVAAGDYVLFALQRQRIIGLKIVRVPLRMSPVVIDISAPGTPEF